MNLYPYVPAENASGLSRRDCDLLRETLDYLNPDWSVDVQTDPLGEVSIMIIPPRVDDTEGPLLIIHKAGLVYCLDEYRWDLYSGIGVFASLHELAEEVRLTLLSHSRVAGHMCQQFASVALRKRWRGC